VTERQASWAFALAVLVGCLATWWFLSDQMDASEGKADREVGCVVDGGEGC
jgi:hypothetical protein